MMNSESRPKGDLAFLVNPHPSLLEMIASIKKLHVFISPIVDIKGPDGKPITSPPQMLGGTCKTGMTKKSYFQVPDSIYQGDTYIEEFKR